MTEPLRQTAPFAAVFGMSESVFADPDITRRNSRVDDYFDILLSYSDMRVHVKGGYFFKQPLPEYSLFGKRGCYLKMRSDVQERQLAMGMSPDDSVYGREPAGREGRLYLGGGNGNEQELVTAPQGNYMKFYDGMYNAIADDLSEPVTAVDGVRVMRVIDAAFESQQSRAIVKLQSGWPQHRWPIFVGHSRRLDAAQIPSYC